MNASHEESYAHDRILCDCGRRALRGWPHCAECMDYHGGRIESFGPVVADSDLDEVKGRDMKIGSAFPSQYLKADDIGQARPVVTIDRVAMEEISGEHKPILYFRGKEKGLVLNRTNANTIIGMTGTEETDQWKGTRVCLYVTKVDFQGKRVPAIRMEDAPVGAAAPPPPPPQDEPAEDVPF